MASTSSRWTTSGPELGGNSAGPASLPHLAARYLETIAGAIHYAHERDIVHRDLKPSNVMIDSEGSRGSLISAWPKSCTVARTRRLPPQLWVHPVILPPEQTLRAGRTERAKRYLFVGAILYELVSGRPPFRAESSVETMRLVVESEPVPLRLLNPSVPRTWKTICLKCLEKSPTKRYGAQPSWPKSWEGSCATSRSGRVRSARREALALVPAQASAGGLSAATLLLLIALATGSTVAVFRIRMESRLATQAHGEANEKLWASYLAQARAEL